MGPENTAPLRGGYAGSRRGPESHVRFRLSLRQSLRHHRCDATSSIAMLTLFDYLPSQNAFKVRLLLQHLAIPYRTVPVSIFEGEGQAPSYRQINPSGAVPAILLDDGRSLCESNAILVYLAEDTVYLPQDRFERAKVNQWLSFEQDYVQNTLGSLRFWTMTSKLSRRPPALVEAKRAAAGNALRILDAALAVRPFICGDEYTVADMSMYAYASRAEEAGISLQAHAHFRRWVERVESQPRFLSVVYPYSIDPHSGNELP
jgi:glutathione S-transferase